MPEIFTIFLYLAVFAAVCVCFWRVVSVVIKHVGSDKESEGLALALTKALMLLIVAFIVVVCAVTGLDTAELFEAIRVALS